MVNTGMYELIQVLWTDPVFHKIVQSEILKNPPKTVNDLADRMYDVLEIVYPDIPPEFHDLTDQDRDHLIDILTARYYALALKNYYDKRSV